MLHSYWLENGCLIFLNIFLYAHLNLLNARRKPLVSRLSSKNFLRFEWGCGWYECFFFLSQCFQNFDSIKELLSLFLIFLNLAFKYTHKIFFQYAYLIFSPPSRNDSANVLGAKNSGTVGMQHPNRRILKPTHLTHL